ncbi:hypothetical protein N0V90_000059 [Kalmusia sp. IMI 367209]|nr:hypothetical protein N0V90_000059 [Kalmusia sp. IMI 367209]
MSGSVSPLNPNQLGPWHQLTPLQQEDLRAQFQDETSAPARKDPSRVPVTLVSTLPPTTYKEEDHPKVRRTDGYISAQILVLNFLDAHATDQLTAVQAQFFTENISLQDGPTVKHAVELCYYMRSLHFDTYAKFSPHENRVKLYVANQDSYDRSNDYVYWEQSMKTGRIIKRHSRGRRNALPNIMDFGGFDGATDAEDEQSLDSELSIDSELENLRVQLDEMLAGISPNPDLVTRMQELSGGNGLELYRDTCPSE